MVNNTTHFLFYKNQIKKFEPHGFLGNQHFELRIILRKFLIFHIIILPKTIIRCMLTRKKKRLIYSTNEPKLTIEHKNTGFFEFHINFFFGVDNSSLNMILKKFLKFGKIEPR